MDKDGEPVLFVYDIDTNIWHREDGLRIRQFAAGSAQGTEHRAQLYALCDYDEELGGYPVWDLTGNEGTLEETVSWSFESGDMYLDEPDNKYVKRYDIRLKAEEPESLLLEIQYDSSGIWEEYGLPRRFAPRNDDLLRTYTIPVLPHRCDHLRYRLSGTGDVKIYSIARIVETGSDAGGS